MTVHLSPSVLHGLRLVTIGFGLASSGLLAGPAHAQQCAPAPMPQPRPARSPARRLVPARR